MRTIKTGSLLREGGGGGGGGGLGPKFPCVHHYF